MKDDNYCTKESARLFRTILGLGYEIFQPGWPLTKLPGCANKFWTEDLLLVRRDFLMEFIRETGEMKEAKWEYQIQVMQDEEFDIVRDGVDYSPGRL